MLPLVPASLLVVDDPDLVLWLQLLGTFSMFPLLVKDKLRIPYWACGQICVAIYFGIKSCMALESKPISGSSLRHNCTTLPCSKALRIDIPISHRECGEEKQC